jgi:hypothetical protein
MAKAPENNPDPSKPPRLQVFPMNFYPTGLNDSVVASAYAPSIPLRRILE